MPTNENVPIKPPTPHITGDFAKLELAIASQLADETILFSPPRFNIKGSMTGRFNHATPATMPNIIYRQKVEKAK